MWLLSAFVAVQLAATVLAKNVVYNFDIGFVHAAPDGFNRSVIGVNGKWPCPKIEATVGDTIIVNVKNKLGSQTTGLHFHGVDQIKTDFMDGSGGTTQCPIRPGGVITYKFLANAPGTFWYHGHEMGQSPDGLRGPLIVHDLPKKDPYAGQYDEEIVMTISDWYHDDSVKLMREMLVTNNTKFIPPIPNALIVNEGRSANISFKEGKTYRIRLINYSALAGAMIAFDSHMMQVIMQDGSYIQKMPAFHLRLAPAQRYDVLLYCQGVSTQNFPFLVAMDANRDYTNKQVPTQWPLNVTGWLQMDSKAYSPPATVDFWNPVDDAAFIPIGKVEPLGPVTRNIVMNFTYCRDEHDLPRACINNQTYVGQKVPTLYSVATTGESNTNPIVYGAVNPYVVKYGDVVQIVINNIDAATHPFHLHGHQFQVLERPDSGAGIWNGGSKNFHKNPASRDTINVNAMSYAVIRFRADNPGVKLFHCHIDWHVVMGGTATIIEGPEKLRGLKMPQDHLDNCKAMKIPVAGNAGGNTKSYLNTASFNSVPDPTYYGAIWPIPSASAVSASAGQASASAAVTSAAKASSTAKTS